MHRTRAPSSAVLALLGLCAAIPPVVLLISGVTAIELLLFVCFQLAFAVVPGLLSYLLLVGRPRLLADTLAVAIPLGLAIQIGCFVLTAAMGERWLFSIYPAVFIIATAPFLYLRRARMTPIPWRQALQVVTCKSAFAVLLVTAGTLFVVYLALFATSPLPREIHSASYSPDLIFHMSLAAELLHHWPIMNPSVSGEALHYHIFVHIAIAATAQVTRLDLSTLVMRLEPTFLVGLIAVELFVLGRKVGGGLAAGLTALALGLFAGELNFSWIRLAGGGIPALGLLFSPSYQLGAVFFLAVCIVLIDHLALETRSRVRYALALGILSFGAVGAKSSVVPVIAGGLALFILGQAPLLGANLKAIKAIHIRSLPIVVTIGVAGYLFIYRGGGDGAIFKPLDFLTYTGFGTIYSHADHSPLYALLSVVAAAVVLCVLLLALLGVLFVRERWLPHRAASHPERLLLCMFAASLLPFVLIGVVGDAQVYFVVYGFLAASVVSAAGLTTVAGALRLKAADVILPGLLCAAGVLAIVIDLWKGRSTVALVPAYAFLTCIVFVTTWLAYRRETRGVTVNARRRILTLGAVVLVCLTVASELFEQTAPTIDHWLRGESAYELSGTNFHRGITTNLLRGLAWLRDHSQPSAVIAVNNHELGGNGGSRYFYYSAFSERRVFLESWRYTPQASRYASLGETVNPFPRLLAINDAAVLRASPAAISLLHDHYGVRYIVIDRLHGPASANLARLTHLVYSNPDISVFKVE
jgi:hypothetical protein